MWAPVNPQDIEAVAAASLTAGFAVVPVCKFLIEQYQYIMVCTALHCTVLHQLRSCADYWLCDWQLKLAKIRSSFRMLEPPAWTELDWQVLLAGSAVNVINKNQTVIEAGSACQSIYRYEAMLSTCTSAPYADTHIARCAMSH
jgi:hypothetical protein